MTALEFIDKHPIAIDQLVRALELAGLPVNYSYGEPCLRTCMSDGVDGVTIEFRLRRYLSDEERAAIENLFPFKAMKTTLTFIGIWDYDYDDDRVWSPSVGFTSELID